MLEHRVLLGIEDWADVEFRRAVEAAWDTVRQGPDDCDSIGAAVHLQQLLRVSGYPRAEVEVRRSVDEALAHVAHFDVTRDPVDRATRHLAVPAAR
ncbi:MAG TPA: hypothetical protein VFP19_09080 [Candidatus Limnocylindrales bacterium]|nr:hypothetical protein [Candidatus Limnocylindrales bacterium]